jgi:hypothetical protein
MKDPVCGMEVAGESGAEKREHKGQTFFSAQLDVLGDSIRGEGDALASVVPACSRES